MWTKQKPIFIDFEGGEGSGKTTQTRILYERLKRSRRMVMYTDEPGATATGFKIRTVLLDHGDEPTDPIAEFLLFEADRAQHISQIIQPTLRQGCDIICDRFSPSTFAYQGYARGLSGKYLATLKKIDAFVRRGVEPDIYILLDIDPAKALRRIKKTKHNRFDAEKLEFHKKVRQGFLKQAKENKKKWCVIDATKSIQAIHEEIWKRVEKEIK